MGKLPIAAKSWSLLTKVASSSSSSSPLQAAMSTSSVNALTSGAPFDLLPRTHATNCGAVATSASPTKSARSIPGFSSSLFSPSATDVEAKSLRFLPQFGIPDSISATNGTTAARGDDGGGGGAAAAAVPGGARAADRSTFLLGRTFRTLQTARSLSTGALTAGTDNLFAFLHRSRDALTTILCWQVHFQLGCVGAEAGG
mmetsp:Transcript_19869/g.49574  ORF Transcript_19869/g.49574 Transcript_19869/m.49574 type:complete len:200 (-) Transcript_19869:27-626(-)